MSGASKGFLSLVVFLIGSVGLAVPAQAENADDNTSRLDHLLQAATHLEQAGRKDLAADIYALVAAETETDRQCLIDARRERIRQFELEIARLQGSPIAADQPIAAGQIVVQVKLIEISWAKLRQSGLGLVSLRNLFESNEAPAIVDEDGQISEFIELLCKEGLAQVLSRPKVMTIDGQSATFEIGQDPATDPAGSRSGMRFECTPRVIDGGRLHLDIELRIQIAKDEKSRENNDDAVAAGRSLQVKTQIEMRSGDTMILAGQRQAAGSDTKSVLILLNAHSPGISAQEPSP